MCRECGALYPDAGDGYDGRCPTCADRAEVRRADDVMTRLSLADQWAAARELDVQGLAAARACGLIFGELNVGGLDVIRVRYGPNGAKGTAEGRAAVAHMRTAARRCGLRISVEQGSGVAFGRVVGPI